TAVPRLVRASSLRDAAGSAGPDGGRMRRIQAPALVLALALVSFPVRDARAHGPETVATYEVIARIEEIVVPTRRWPLSAASSREINLRDYLLRPHSTTQEILNNVPGLLVVQHQGGGKAFQYFIRGFDIDPGT